MSGWRQDSAERKTLHLKRESIGALQRLFAAVLAAGTAFAALLHAAGDVMLVDTVSFCGSQSRSFRNCDDTSRPAVAELKQ